MKGFQACLKGLRRYFHSHWITLKIATQNRVTVAIKILKMPEEITFIVSDESRNSYGFKLKSDGGDFSQFRKNPVLLHDHKEWEMPRGTWKDLTLHDNKDITAVPIFDMDDDDAVKLKKKVDKGIIKMASVGVIPLEFDEDNNIVTKWLLREISITTFGSNHNAFALYDTKGIELKSRDEVLQLSATTKEFNHVKSKTKMSTESNLGIMLRAGLNLSENTTDSDLIRTVLNLSTKNAALEQQVAGLQKEKDDAAKAIQLQEKNNLLDQAVQDKKITLSQKDVYAKMETEDLKTVLAGLTPVTNLSDVPGQHHGGGQGAWDKRMSEINGQ